MGVLREARAAGRLPPGGLVTEGTAGSTGVSLAMAARAAGCRCHVVMPDDAAAEKAALIRAHGGAVERVRPVAIAHPGHFVHVAAAKARATPGGVFAAQFEKGLFRFAGTVIGTIAGVSAALKAHDAAIRVHLVDPPGSGLYNRVERGVLYTRHEAEGKRLRNPFDTVTEGIGINRLTENFRRARIDGAVQGTDQEAVDMAVHLLREDGLFVGSSAAMNCVGAVKVAKALGPGHTVVTVLCDGGARHLSKFHCPEYLARHGLRYPGEDWRLDFAAL